MKAHSLNLFRSAPVFPPSRRAKAPLPRDGGWRFLDTARTEETLPKAAQGCRTPNSLWFVNRSTKPGPLCVLCILLGGLTARAAVTAPPTRRVQNFVVQDLRGPAPSSANLKAAEGKKIVKLDVDVLALSVERIKRVLCKELDFPTRGWGKVHLFLVSAPETEQDVRIVSTLFADGWQYRVEIPDRLEELKLIRGTVEVLLLELANRGAGPKSAEIPVWLNEGLALQLKNSVGPDLVLPSVPVGSMFPSVRDIWGVDKLREARSVFRSFAPATFAELGHPELGTLTGDSLKRYQSSAQLFVEELCRLRNGRACLVNMLRELPSCWNWETAFLRAFQRHFSRTLDVEKWWTVTLIGVTGRDPTQVWPPEICLEKLDEILLMPADVRLSSDVMPVRTYVTPQQIIAEWEYPLQKSALQQTLSQLTVLKFNCPLEAAASMKRNRLDADQSERDLRCVLEVAALIERYRLAFQNYLQKRAEASSVAGNQRRFTISVPLLARETVRRLDELYRQREALRRDCATVSASSGKP